MAHTVPAAEGVPDPIPVELPEGLPLSELLPLPIELPLKDCVEDPEMLAEPLTEGKEGLARPLGLTDPDEHGEELWELVVVSATDPDTTLVALTVSPDEVDETLGERLALGLRVITEGDSAALPETVAEPVLLVDPERDPLAVPLPVRDCLPVPVEHMEPVPVFDTDTDPVPLTVPVEVFDAVDVVVSLTVEVVESVAVSDADPLAVVLAWPVALTVSHPLVLGLTLAERETDGLPLSLNVRVASVELVTLGLLEALPE